MVRRRTDLRGVRRGVYRRAAGNRLKKGRATEVTEGTTVVEAMPGLRQKQSYKQGAIRFDPWSKAAPRQSLMMFVNLAELGGPQIGRGSFRA
jgi:hypothetical protein